MVVAPGAGQNVGSCFRLANVGPICAGALVKTDEQEVINFLLTTEIIPLCLRIMESGSELSKTVRCPGGLLTQWFSTFF